MDNPINGPSYKVVASRGLNLRMEPTTSSQIILAMPNGSVVKLASDKVPESDGYKWYNVMYGDKTGWAAKDYLEPESSRGIVSDLAVEVFFVSYNKKEVYPFARLNSIPENIPNPAGTGVTFMLNNKPYATTLDKWLIAAGKDKNGRQNYPIL